MTDQFKDKVAIVIGGASGIRRALYEALSQYGPAIAAIRGRAAKASAPREPTSEVAKVVAHALTSERPMTRYVNGRAARTRLLLELLPVPSVIGSSHGVCLNTDASVSTPGSMEANGPRFCGALPAAA